MTSLPLSRSIAESRDSYYRSFRDVEDKLNHGELTPFVTNILENVEMAQDQLDADLTHKRSQLDTAAMKIDALVDSASIFDKEAQIIFQLVQLDLFGPFPETSVNVVSQQISLSSQQTRRYLGKLEGDGFVEPISRRPLRYVLTDTARTYFGLPKP